MRKQRYTPYFFDFKYEKRTYEHIGKDYGNRRTADRGWICNFLRWYRKRIYNRKESKYKFCNTYEEWRSYLLEREFGNAYDKQNMIRFLCKRKKNSEKLFEAIKTIIIPIYISLNSGMIEATEAESIKSMFLCMIFILLIIIVSFYFIFTLKNRIYFYTDYIDCLNNE